VFHNYFIIAKVLANCLVKDTQCSMFKFPPGVVFIFGLCMFTIRYVLIIT